MGVGVGSLLRTTVVVLVVAFVLAGALGAGLAGKAGARANIDDYTSKGPNDFYPSGHDREGSLKLAAIDTLGWNATRVAGNLGIGNGSVAIFNQTSTTDVEYPSTGFMCGDVSQQPWTPGRESIAGSAVNESGKGDATENATRDDGQAGVNVTGPAAHIISSHTDAGARGDEGGNVPDTGQADAGSENLAYAAFHPIQYLNPVKDLLYEHPLATPGTAFCELLGFVPPSGVPVNVGMKCTGYGY